MEANTQTWLIVLTLTNIAIILVVCIWYSLLKLDVDIIKEKIERIWSMEWEVMSMKRKFKNMEKEEELEEYYQNRIKSCDR